MIQMKTQEKATMVCKVCVKKRSRRHQYCSICAKKAILDSRRKWRRKVKIEVLSNYSSQNYPICNWNGCAETNLEKLCLDHVNGGGREHMKSINLYNKKNKKIKSGHPFYGWLKLHKYPNNPPLQVLCRKHNQDKQILYKER